MAKLLIVEDERDIRDISANFFRKRGIDVLVASEGRQGLYLINKEHPDLVLLDINMHPGMSGIEVLKEMKRRNLSAKVVMVSGYLTDDYIRETKGLGAIDFINKPIILPDLAKVVFAHLNIAQESK